MIIGIVKEAVHKKGQIDLKCAIHCDIKGHVSTGFFGAFSKNSRAAAKKLKAKSGQKTQ